MSATAFDTIRNVLNQVQAPAQAQTSPVSASTLMDFARQNHYRVTSGFSTHGHSPGSKHYQGTKDDPGAIDIDHRGVDLANLQKLARQNGYTVLDEVNHPSAYSTGPHYHIQKGGSPARKAGGIQPSATALTQQPQRQSIDISIPQMRPGQAFAPLPQGLTNFSVPTRQQSQTNNKAAQSAVKQATLDPAVTQPTAAHPALDGIRKVLDDVKRAPKLPPAATTPAHPDTNFAGDLYNHAVNRLSGSTQDQLVRDSGHGWGAGIGDFIGDVGFIGAGALGGAGLGGLTLTPFGVGAGAVGGGVAAAGTAGAAQELQRQRLAGEQADYLKAAGSGAIQAGLQAIPVVKGATLLTTVGKNAALQGGGAAIGSVGQQAIEQGTLTPKIDTRRIINEAGLGAAGGTVGAGIEHRFGNARVPREIEPPSAFRDAANADTAYIQAAKERTAFDQKLEKQYKGGFEARKAELQQKVESRAATPKEFAEHQKIQELTQKRDELQGNAATANKQAGEYNRVYSRENLGLSLTPEEKARVDVTFKGEGEKPDVQELTKAFEERQRPETKELFDPRTQELPQELGPLRTETSEGGIEIATRAGKRESKELELPPSYEKQENISQGGSPRQRVREIGDSGLLDASGSPISRPKPSAEILTPGNAERPQTRELELPSSYRREVPQEPTKAMETPDATAESTVSSEKKQGSFTDTINEILKDSGTDFEGVRSLKAEMDRLSEIAKTGGRAGAREAKAQLKDLKERWKAVPENVRELAGSDFDPESGIGKQRAVNPESQHTLDRVRGELDAQAGPIAERINEALQKGTRVRLKYIGEQVGRSNEVAKLSKGGKAVVQASEFSPTHFGYFNATYADGKRRVPAVFGYNQRGHQVGYYLNKSPKGSHIQQVLSVTDKPAFRGAMANVYHGAGDYNVSDVLARGPRTERGFVKTSEAIRALHEQKKAIREAAAQDANLSPDVKSTMERLFSGQEFSYDDIKAMRKEMSDPSRLATFCKHMGLT